MAAAAPAPDSAQCWQALANRDASQDGRFFYGVVTTGVFCRPSCPSRLPKPENVRFYATADGARRDGLRPCLRCRPLLVVKSASNAAAAADPLTERMQELCRYIEQHCVDEALTLAALARRAQLSPYHLQRSFKAIVGVSPKQYVDNCRMRSFKSALRRRRPESGGEGVTGAIYEAGFSSPSRVYERSDAALGMTPMEYRAGGRGVSITYAIAPTPLGLVLLGATDRGLCFLEFGPDEAALRGALEAEYPNARLSPMAAPAPEAFAAWVAALNGYLSGQTPDLALPLHVRATAFQIQVWKYLQSIPAGQTRNYAEVARGIGQPAAVRAVARACASNVVALAIPCHRVIRGDGGLGGYKWGMDRKQALLEREAAGAASKR